MWPCIQTYIAFCLIASGIYCFNDVYDAEADRRHPTKCMRPIARGAFSVQVAYAAMVVLCGIAFEGKLTGRFSSPNCYGAQKVDRLLEVYPQGNISYLYAYGDSQGDKELLEFADEGFYLGH